MFDRSHRFSFKKGAPKRIFATPLFVIRFDTNNDKLHSSVVVGKKVDKRAVVRNRIKRQINAILKEVLSTELKFDIVFFIKKQINEAETDNIKETIFKSLKEIHILK
jgi:ribonuclease P protein component